MYPLTAIWQMLPGTGKLRCAEQQAAAALLDSVDLHTKASASR